MSGVRGSVDSLNRLRSSIKALPLQVRAEVAKKAAGILTDAMREDFDAGRTVYDTPRRKSTTGGTLTLVQSGKTKGALKFVTVGTIVRAQLGTKYAPYLVGKYQIMPRRLPASWSVKLGALVAEHAAQFQREALR